jgi:hypothetical protein
MAAFFTLCFWKRTRPAPCQVDTQEATLNTQRTIHLLAFATLAIAFAASADAQQLVQQYNYQETAGQVPQGNTLIFGVAAYQLCTIKNFLFMGVYILAAIAFVIFAVKALFTRFEFKSFLPILGAIFVVAFADLFIAFIAPQAYYCPTVLSQFSAPNQR